MSAPVDVLEPIYADRPDEATRVIRSGEVIGTVFRNWQGWISAIWRPFPASASCEVHSTRDAALARVGGES